MYIHISSDQSTSYFSNNSPSGFRVKMPYTINLDHGIQYEIAILQITTPPLKNQYNPKYITINTNMCESSIINNTLRPILRLMHVDSLGETIEFSAPQYHNVTSHSIDLIDLYLSDDSNSEPSFEQGTLYVTLHIRPKTESN